MDVLERFIEVDDFGITELAEDVGLSPSTVHRIVRALVGRGYLEQRRNTNRYSLGLNAALLGQASSRRHGLDKALPILERFGRETGESINMGVLDGDEVVVILRVASQQQLRFDQPVGSRLSLHCTSMGKSLLAFGGELDATRLDSLEFDKVTPKTIGSVNELLADIEATRARGYSVDHEESLAGVSCIGAPVIGRSGVAAAAVAVQGPTVRMTQERMVDLGERLVDVAAEVATATNLAG